MWPRGWVDIWLYSSMTTALEGGEWSAAHPGRTLPLGKTPVPILQEAGWPQGRSGRVENLFPIGIRSRTIQPVVSRYTDRATGPTIKWMMLHLKINKTKSLISTILWASHGIFSLLQNKADYSRGQKRSPMFPNLSQISPSHNLPVYFTNIYSNINFAAVSLTPASPNRILCVFLSSQHMCYVIRLSHPPAPFMCLTPCPTSVLANTPRTKPNPTHGHLLCRLRASVPVQEAVSTHSTGVGKSSYAGNGWSLLCLQTVLNKRWWEAEGRFGSLDAWRHSNGQLMSYAGIITPHDPRVNKSLYYVTLRSL